MNSDAVNLPYDEDDDDDVDDVNRQVFNPWISIISRATIKKRLTLDI